MGILPNTYGQSPVTDYISNPFGYDYEADQAKKKQNKKDDESRRRYWESNRDLKRQQRAGFDTAYADLKNQSLYDVFLRVSPDASQKLDLTQKNLAVDDDNWQGSNAGIMNYYSSLYKEMEGTGMLRYLSGTTKGRDSTILNSEALNTAQKTILGK